MSDNVIEDPEKTAPPDKSLESEGKKIALGGSIVMMGTLIAQGLGMITTIWLARALGPEQYGLLTLALATLMPIATLATLGLNKTVVRFIPIHIGRKENDRVAGTLYTALAIAAIASVTVVFFVYLLAPLLADLFNEERLVPVLQVLVFTVPLTVGVTIAAASTRGLKVMHYDALIKIARPLFRLLVWVAGFFLLANLFRAAIYASLIGGLLTFIVAIGIAYWGFRYFLRDGVTWSFKSVLVYSIPLVFSTLMYALSPRIDRLLLGVIADVRTVGVYSAAASLIMILKLVHSSITMTFSPIVADAYNRVSVNRAKRLYVMVTHWDARLTFLAVLIAILLASELLWLFGDQYTEAIEPFVILAISVFITTISGPTGAFLQMTNRQRIDAMNALIFFIISPLVQLLFVAWLGWIGVAVGVLVAAIIINTLQVSEIQHFYKFHPFQRHYLIFTIVATIVLVLCTIISLQYDFLFRMLILGGILIGFFIYIYIYRTPNDEMLLNMILPKRFKETK